MNPSALKTFLCLSALLAISQPTLAQSQPRLWLAGDSTVNNNVNAGVGWGNTIASEFNIDVVNRAIGGRSSRSFWRDEFDYRINQFPTQFGGPWNEGDFLIIQFGHNDGGNPATSHLSSINGTGEQTVAGTDKSGNPETVHTYGWYLRQMINEARNNNVIPILASRVPRAGDTNPTLSGSGYPEWASIIAQEEGVGFIDLYGMVINFYNDERAANPGDPNYIRNTYFGPDATHTNQLGADLNAAFVAEGVRGLTGESAALKQYLVVTPEPGSAALIGSASIMLLIGRRRNLRS